MKNWGPLPDTSAYWLERQQKFLKCQAAPDRTSNTTGVVLVKEGEVSTKSFFFTKLSLITKEYSFRQFSGIEVKLGQDQKLVIEGVTLEASLQQNGCLQLSKYDITSGKDASAKLAIENAANEVGKRKEDLVAVEAKITELQRQAQEPDASDEVGLEIGRMLGVKGQHTRRIKQIEDNKTVTVTYEVTKVRVSLVLQPGIAVTPVFLSHPIIWVLRDAGTVQSLKEKKTEEIPKVQHKGTWGNSQCRSMVAVGKCRGYKVDHQSKSYCECGLPNNSCGLFGRTGHTRRYCPCLHGTRGYMWSCCGSVDRDLFICESPAPSSYLQAKRNLFAGDEWDNEGEEY
eukprot:g39687.t1